MQTYEVSLPLETGHVLNVVIASADEKWAVSEVAQMLRSIGVNDGEHYAADEVTVKPVDIRPIFAAA